jgi:hypothetical protein
MTKKKPNGKNKNNFFVFRMCSETTWDGSHQQSCKQSAPSKCELLKLP